MNEANAVLTRLLENLERCIDLDHAAAVAARHQAALRYEALDRLPLVCYLPYEGQDFTPYPYPEAYADPAKMMVNELLVGFTSIYHAVDLWDDSPYCLRPNFGVTIIASMFGAEVRLLGDAMPWVRPLPAKPNAIQGLVEKPLPDLDAGLLPRVLEQMAFYRTALEGYPKCQAAFQPTLPDLQGPFSIAELLWGPDIYLALFDQPEWVDALMAKITELIVLVYRRLAGEVRDNIGPAWQYQHATAVRGKMLVRDDSAINISPVQYRRFIQPHNARLAAELGEIGIHFCGNGMHQVDNMLAIEGVGCLDIGQPEMMDLDALYEKAAARGVALARLSVPQYELVAGLVKQRFPRGVNLLFHASSVPEAHQVWQRYCGED